MSASASRTYENQNDQQLDELHSKLRTLRSVTIDIHDDTQRQNLDLDNSRDSFTSFGSGLAQSTRNAAKAFSAGGASQMRMIFYAVTVTFALWLGWKITRALLSWWSG